MKIWEKYLLEKRKERLRRLAKQKIKNNPLFFGSISKRRQLLSKVDPEYINELTIKDFE
jgi:hypothetical protein